MTQEPGGCPVSGDYTCAPLGPDSLTWKLFGDWRGLLQGPWAGSMQNMHPQLGAAVKDHSIFFRERLPRLLRLLHERPSPPALGRTLRYCSLHPPQRARIL